MVRPLKDPELVRSTRSLRVFGTLLIISVVAAFFYWGANAPLEGAVVASGSVVVDSNRKVVQHLEGGIIETILVKNGDIVDLGTPLVVLDNSMVENKRGLFLWNLHVGMANKARLSAERDGLKSVPFDIFLEKIRVKEGETLSDKEQKELEKIIAQQENIFKTRRRSISEQVSILRKRISQLRNQIGGYNSQRSSTKEQISYIQDELGTVRQLLERGLEQKPRLLSLQRREAELQGKIGDLTSQIAKTQDTINENDLAIHNVRTEAQKEIASELKETDEQIAELQENYLSMDNVFQRTAINAPQSGIVTNLRFHTPGGVIQPGEPILEIVPQNDELVIDVRLLPLDIDAVTVGQTAHVMLSAFLARHVPKLVGEVVQVSPDRLMDELTGDFYYQLRVRITPEEIAKLPPKITLYPGMPAEVFLITEERTMLEYLFYPIQSSFNRAFRE